MIPAVRNRNHSSPERQLRKRRRPALSCIDCRRRKVKCDRNNPCNHCTTSKRPCKYRHPLDVDFSVQEYGISDTSTTSTTLPAIDGNGAESPTITSTPYNAGPTVTVPQLHNRQNGTHGETVLDPPINQSPANNRSSLEDLTSRVRLLEQALSAATSKLCKADEFRPPVLKGGNATLSKTRVFGQSHWISASNEFKKIRCFLSGQFEDTSTPETNRAAVTEMLELLRKCKALAKGVKAARPSRCLSCPDPIYPLPPREVADTLAQLYLSSFESVFRILHIPTFQNEYEQFWANPAAAPADLRLKILLVIATGCSLYPGSPDEHELRSMACQAVYHAQNWLAGPLEKDRLTINGLQIQCLLMLARQTLSVGADLIWVSMGSVMRSAMQMGLHRDPKNFSSMSTLQAELRRRLWATILEMSLQASLDAGMPPMFSFDDFDTEAPFNLDDADIGNADLPEERAGKGNAKTTDVSMQLLFLDGLRSRFEVVRCMNGLHSDLPYDKALALSSEINTTCRQIALLAQRRGTCPGSFQDILADYLLQRFLLSLHRPFASRARSQPMYYFSRQACVDAAIAITCPSRDVHFSHLMVVGSGIFKNSLIHAAAAISLELITETEGGAGSTVSFARRTSYKEMLVNAVKDALSLSARRIEYGETNVRLHMMLSMVLTQIESYDSGDLTMQRIARSAKDSLQQSYSRLQKRYGPASAGSWCNETNTAMAFSEHIPDEFAGESNFDDFLIQDMDVFDGIFEYYPSVL